MRLRFGLWVKIGSIIIASCFLLTTGLPSAIPSQPKVLASGDSPPGMSAPQILVGLFRASAVTFTCQGPWSLSASDSGPKDLSAGASATLRHSGSGISWQLSGSAQGSKQGTCYGNIMLSVDSPSGGPFLTVQDQENATLGLEGKAFRGSMIVMAAEAGLLVANALDFEEYIQSVVGGEVPDGWPEETNRAQAIAARSYAAYQTRLRPGAERPDYTASFRTVSPNDVLIWASDQVYRGICEETAVTVAATESTRGQVLTYGGIPIAAYYHSDAGGITEDPRYVWGSSVPYLLAVKEEPHESPHSWWSVELEPAQVLTAVRQLGLTLQGQPESLSGSDGGTSGRWYCVSVQSAYDSVTVRGTDLRRVLPQVKSTLFSAYSVGGGKPTTGSLSAGMSYSVASADGVYSVELGGASAVGETGNVVACSKGAAVVSDQKAERPPAIVLQGAGWGHGVGLSQWGARGMALSGCDARSILLFYYPDTVMEQWW